MVLHNQGRINSPRDPYFHGSSPHSIWSVTHLLKAMISALWFLVTLPFRGILGDRLAWPPDGHDPGVLAHGRGRGPLGQSALLHRHPALPGGARTDTPLLRLTD